MLPYKLLLIGITCLFNVVSAVHYIKSSSLLTCMDNSQFTASYFDIVFYPGNRTIYFDINAISSIDAKVGAYINVIVYGLNVVQRNISLCDIDYESSGSGANPLCPLTSGHLNLDSHYQIGSSISSQIPGIAYTVPDVDARVKVLIYDLESYDQLACVEATLSNGKTVQTKYAGWPIAAISGLGVITSGVISVIGHSSTAAHIASNSMSLFVYFQSLAIMAMMAVARVPPIAAAWAQNFMWSVGLIKIGFVQDISNWYIQATGGTPTDILGASYLSISVQRFAKRAMEWYEGMNSYDLAGLSSSSGSSLAKRANILLDSDTFGTADSLDPDLYSTNEKATDLSGKILVLRGIQRVAYLASIEITDVFMTGICFLFFFAFVMVVCLMLFKAIIEILTRSKAMHAEKFNEYRHHWGGIIKGSLYRLLIIAFPQVSVLCIWELTARDSAGAVVVAVFLLVITLVLLIQAATRVFLMGRNSVRNFKNPAYLLFGDVKFLNKFGFLYVQYRADCFWFIWVSLFYIFIKSLLVAVLQHHGKPQSVIIWVIELIHLVVVCWIRPFMDKRTNAFNITISVINFINALFFMFFSSVFGQPNVVSSVMAVVYFVLNAVFALFLLIFTIVTCLLAIVRKNPDARYQPMRDDRVSFLPKSAGKKGAGTGGDDDMELMALGATAMKGHEHGKRDPLAYDDESYDEDSIYQNTRNLSGPALGGEGTTSTGSGSNDYSPSKRDSISFMEPTQPGSTIVGNPYNALPTNYSNENNASTGSGFSFGQTGAYQGSSSSPQNPYFQNTSYSNNQYYQQRNPSGSRTAFR